MKKTIGLIFLVAITIYGIHLLKTAAPFMPVAGNSMEPELMRGSLIVIEPISPSQVKEGDIIVFNVPALIQEQYNYPPVVAHRAIEVNTEGEINFRTKGDNTGEDPFTVLAPDLRGQVGKQIPYLGYGFFFLQSREGLIFIIIGLCLLALYLYAGELSRGRQTVQRGIFAPVIEESQRSSRVMAQRMEATEKGMESTQQALNNFASAMSEYARHLASHTDAIKSLAGASQELRDTVREIVSHLKKDSLPPDRSHNDRRKQK